MPTCKIYLDESGDLGFTFDSPYRAGGSSRHLTLAATVCCEDSNKYVKRLMANFAKDGGVPAGTEVKWVDLSPGRRLDFAKRAAKLTLDREHVYFATITVFKQRVQDHIRKDPNKLYNYMTGLLLLELMTNFDHVHFIPDARSIKVQSGNSLHDYLQTQLWFERKAKTQLTTDPSDSSKSRALQFTDYLCGTFQSHYEDGRSDAWNVLAQHMMCKRLYFP